MARNSQAEDKDGVSHVVQDKEEALAFG